MNAIMQWRFVTEHKLLLILLSVQTSPHVCGEIKHLLFISVNCSHVSYELVVSNLTVVTDLLSYICPVVTLPYWEMLRISSQSMLVLLVVSTHSISVWVSPSYNKFDTTLKH